MTPFLKQVALHYCKECRLEDYCFVFPNRRSLSFFKKHLKDIIATEQSGKPQIAPEMFTMNDFFYKMSDSRPSDKVRLLLNLYESYKELNQAAEPLDDFIFWGDVLLGDFDDVDKYLVDTGHLFANIADLKSIEDSYSYLSETQLKAIKRFISHFRDNAGGMKVDIDNDKNYKVRFLKIWNILGPLYQSFNARLREEGISYEGQVYRELAERLDSESAADIMARAFPHSGKFVFVGLNALNECEKKLLRKLRNAKLAEFCWDFSGPRIQDRSNKASLFLSENVVEFPNSFETDTESKLPETEFEVISVPSATGQAKQLPSILRALANPGIDTAIVLPDETMLTSVLNSIPENIKDINVTMGYPMESSEMHSLMTHLAELQLRIRKVGGKCLFYHKPVREIFSNSLFKSVISDKASETVKAVKEGVKYYIPVEDFKGDPFLELLFQEVPEDINAIEKYQQDVLEAVSMAIKGNPSLAMELDFAREYYLAIGKLKNFDLPVKPQTYYRLLSSLVTLASVPFEGEPLKGLQIMGPLETRALDFDNVIILNCNEGMFPRVSVSSSFIPPELRKSFGLPTYEFQDAVWAYYFYRLITRARKVTMLFDSRTDMSRTGEKSRFIRQLEMHFGVKIQESVVDMPAIAAADSEEIPKTEEDIRILKSKYLSASSLQDYLRCPAMLYYKKVKGLKAENEVSEDLDASMTGNVFHETMEDIFREGPATVSRLKEILKNREGIQAKVGEKIKAQLNCLDIRGKNIIYQDIIVSYVLQVLKRDIELLETGKLNEFKVIGLEKELKGEIGGFKFLGYADRIDSLRHGEVRIVDYKTGKVKDDEIYIDDDSAEDVVDKLFGEDESKRPKIALQLYLYDTMARKIIGNEKIFNSIYQVHKFFRKGVENITESRKFNELMKVRLEELLSEIADPLNPWLKAVPGSKCCEYCDFKNICGR